MYRALMQQGHGNRSSPGASPGAACVRATRSLYALFVAVALKPRSIGFARSDIESLGVVA